MDLNDIQLRPNPLLKANPISKLLSIWIIPFLWAGAKKDLNLSDVYSCIPDDSSEKLGNFVEEEWEKELKKARLQGGGRRPKLWRVIRSMIWKRYFVVGVACCFDELFLRVMLPISLRNFIGTFSKSEEDYPNVKRDQYLYAGALVLLSLTHAILFQRIISTTIHIGMKVRLGISSLIYRKILRLRRSDSEYTNVGRLCNMLASDVSRFDQGFNLLHFFYICPLQIGIYCYLLWMEIGWSCLGGISCIIFLLPFQVMFGRISMYFRTRIASRTDERGRFLNEIVAGIRLIKMYAWEKPFCLVVSKLRASEILYIRRGLYLRGAFVSLQIISQRLNPFCALILFVALGNTLTADKAFYTVSIFGILQTIMNRIPNGASQLGEMVASANRIEDFLASKKTISAAKNDFVKKKSTITAANGVGLDDSLKSRKISWNEIVEPSIIFQNYTASWTEAQETLKDLNVNLKGNKLVMVVGHVGAGKSSFLNAILSELPIISSGGECAIEGRLSYASQEAWIFPASLRQNILFGLDMDEERYWNTIKLCCLQDDLDQFSDGDLSLVGERGVALSGGQKARVNLARAIYQSADIYLLDDPLSAVDTKVSRLLFDGLIKEHLRDKMRILVSHQLQYMPMADHIIVLNREGGIWFQGTYEELQNSETDFTSLISDSFMSTANAADVDELLQEEGSEAKSAESSRPDTPVENGKPETKNLLTGATATGRMKEEQKQVGSVGVGTYMGYFKSGGSYLTMIFLLMGFVTGHFLYSFLNYWLGLWTNAVSDEVDDDDVIVKNATIANYNSTGGNMSSSIKDDFWTIFGDDTTEQDFYTYIYCGLMGAFIIMTLFRTILFFRYCMKISINLHDSMFRSLVRAPVKFFDENPSGRILNRYTKDLNQVDELLPVSFYDCVDVFLALLGMLAVNIAANYFIAVPAVILLFALWRLRRFYLATARDLKRIESLAKSPMFTHVTMTAQGLTTIRALQAEGRLLDQFQKIQNTHTGVYFTLFSTNRWFAVWLELFSCMFLAVVAFGFPILTTSSQGGDVGMAISSILVLAGSLQWGIRQSAETENFMTSVERVFEYCSLKAEAPLEISNDAQVKQNWPSNGRINFHSVSLSYEGGSSGNKVLNDVTFSTEPKEKIGIVGRTGAGKSSLITALFRMTELCEGIISIDDIEIQNLGLHTLRSQISIIPQDPVLFTGTLRYNLDPFDEFSDDQLWRVLQEVDLHHTVQSLDYKVDDGGSNFSTGQRQLICLARAILRNNQILVLDEPTANVDPVTDQMVQQTIRTKFSDCTILTIAHRLQSVLDSDRIIVLDVGRVVEFGTPEALASNPNGVFSAMLRQSNLES